MPEGPEQYTPPEAEEKISLRHLLTNENPRIAEYQRLASSEKRGGSRLGDEFAPQWGRIFCLWGDRNQEPLYNPPGWEKARAYFQEKLSGGILIDVGGGSGWTANVMRAFAKKFGVQTYINVDHGQVPDPYTARRARAYDYLDLPPEERARPMEDYLVAADMLDFVARLPNNSSNFTENGIDQYILGMSDEGSKYGKALFEEMVRATEVGGIIFGIESDMCGRGDQRLKDVTEELGFSREHWGSRHEVFEKIKE